MIAAILTYSNVEWIGLVLFVVSYLVAGGDVLYKAVRNILHGRVFDENLLMTIATIGALCIGKYTEAVAVMLFYQVGELFQSYAVAKSRKSISELMNIRPDHANVKRGDTISTVDPDEVLIGELIVVKVGEKVPLDGEVIDGTSYLDTSALTGESVPREVSAGSEILSGCINLNGLLTVKVTKNFEESTVSKILDLVENASSKKSKSENFITKFARIYTPIVVVVALLLAVVPTLVLPGAIFSDWLYRALTFLVVSCPCALVISIPLSFFGGLGGASKKGILIKGSNYLEALAKTEIIVFDKTGTLTEGVFEVQDIRSVGITSDKLLELATYAENYSTHPISMSLKRSYGKDIDPSCVKNVKEIAGHGVIANVNDNTVAVGNGKLMNELGVSYLDDEIVGTILHVSVDGTYAGYISISDKLKPDAFEAVTKLKSKNVKKVVMLTGDSDLVGTRIAKKLNIDEVYTDLLPADKVEKVEELINQKSEKGILTFVGDGINDAPVLARADIGVAMGGMGSDAAIEAADVVIMTDEPSKIIDAIGISKRTLGIVYQNIAFALIVKIVVLILAAFGMANMWEAIFADVGVSIIAILNSFRALWVGNSVNADLSSSIPSSEGTEIA
ncbi:ATPase P [Candidatus Methanomassiliicoccus intestinalis Issoire-Mx1]|uniref:ATPase P n=1 Tax=Methanomassiliicoccus intestinalis (strain Issoire-Mx1) TaxID=1295009 RepID=R9T6A0_METII|nr:heavy metal translocating P-type ATPase [Candidatus Methanomassiliicoccus intestinalis]AGN26230.1 ATPase P [Candidatus Methanomassiliicoccus intestinalis Issoire-Mx1]